MTKIGLRLRLFSRRRFDAEAAAKQLRFLLDYAGGIFRPDECGAYEPYEPFRESEFESYVSWVTAPGWGFGFHHLPPPFAVRGHLDNLLLPEIFTTEPGSTESHPMAQSVPDPVFCIRWGLRMSVAATDFPGTEFFKDLLCDACRVSRADYGMIANEGDFKNKHFSSVRRGDATIEEYLGTDPAQGLPGLYWMNFFGPMYVAWFGPGKIARLAGVAEAAVLLEGALYLRFGDGPEDIGSERVSHQLREAIRIFGETAFFDIHRPNRVLDVPVDLR
jgi:hypothetical protein